MSKGLMRRIPPPLAKVVVQVRIEPEQYRRLRQVALDRDESMTSIVMRAVEIHLDEIAPSTR